MRNATKAARTGQRQPQPPQGNPVRYTLRDYQIDAVGRIRQQLLRGRRRVLAVAPTGAGKTLMFCLGIISPSVERGKRAWIVVPRRQLVGQTSQKLDDIGVTDHGVLQGNHWRTRYKATVQVCSKDTLARRMEKIKLPTPDLIVWDEAHHLTDDNSYGELLARFPEAVHIGFTATPCRLDGRGLGSVFEEMIQVTTINELIARGYLVPPRVFAAATADLSGVKTQHGDYNQKQLGERMSGSRILGDIVQEWLKHGEGRPTVGFAVNVEHSQRLVAMFKEVGVAAAHIDADTPQEQRDVMIAHLDHGRIKILFSVGVFTEGFDLPSVGCVIFARPSMSLSLYIQMAGRGLRPAKGIAQPGENCIFLDHAGLTHRHGFVTEDREWSLADGARPEKKEKRLFSCTGCAAELRNWPPFCPLCGARLREEDREQAELPLPDSTPLKEITEADLQASVEERQEAYRQLEEEAYLFNREAWWPGWKFKQRFKVYPTAKDRRTSQNRIKLVQKSDGSGWEAAWSHEQMGGESA